MVSDLFQRVGGEATVEAAVNRFYSKFLKHGEISHFFEFVDMDSQRMKLRVFFRLILGGNRKYSIDRLIATHRPMLKSDLSISHVELWLALTQETLNELDIPKELIDEFMERCEPFRVALIEMINQEK